MCLDLILELWQSFLFQNFALEQQKNEAAALLFSHPHCATYHSKLQPFCLLHPTSPIPFSAAICRLSGAPFTNPFPPSTPHL